MRSAATCSETFVIRPALAATFCGLLVLAGCSKPAAEDSADPAAGLDTEILAWRTDLEANHSTCSAKVEGKGCDTFEVTCKAMQEIDAAEKGKGVSSQIVASMAFNGRGEGKPGSAFAVFSKADGKWTRAESPPVNMSTCAPM